VRFRAIVHIPGKTGAIPERVGALAARPGEQTGHPVINQPLRLYAEALRKIDRSW